MEFYSHPSDAVLWWPRPWERATVGASFEIPWAWHLQSDGVAGTWAESPASSNPCWATRCDCPCEPPDSCTIAPWRRGTNAWGTGTRRVNWAFRRRLQKGSPPGETRRRAPWKCRSDWAAPSHSFPSKPSKWRWCSCWDSASVPAGSCTHPHWGGELKGN